MNQVTTKHFVTPIASDGACAPEEVSKDTTPQEYAKGDFAQKGYARGFRFFTQDFMHGPDGKVFEGEPRQDKTTYYFGDGIMSAKDYVAQNRHSTDRMIQWTVGNIEHGIQYNGLKTVGIRNGAPFSLGDGDAVITKQGNILRISDNPADENLSI